MAYAQEGVARAAPSQEVVCAPKVLGRAAATDAVQCGGGSGGTSVGALAGLPHNCSHLDSCAQQNTQSRIAPTNVPAHTLAQAPSHTPSQPPTATPNTALRAPLQPRLCTLPPGHLHPAMRTVVAVGDTVRDPDHHRARRVAGRVMLRRI